MTLRRIPAIVLTAACLLPTAARAADWPQWRGPARDGVWKETGIVEKFAGPEIKVKWRAPVSNGYSAPIVANGRVLVTDLVKEPKSQERVLCFREADGKPLWTRAYDCNYGTIQVPNGPRACVAVSEGKVYSLGATGQLYCLNAADGKVVWHHDCQTEYKIRMPDWGISAAPLVEGNNVVVMIGGEGNACLVAFNKKTGKEQWRSLEDRASYSPPVMVNQAGKRVLVAWTGDRVVGLNPKDGKPYWSYPFECKQNVDPCMAPEIAGDKLFVSAVYEGALMLRLKTDSLGVEKVWEKNAQSPRNPRSTPCSPPPSSRATTSTASTTSASSAASTPTPASASGRTRP